jgi:hypothetical protein
MEMTWENLTKLFTWAAQHGSEAPMADTEGSGSICLQQSGSAPQGSLLGSSLLRRLGVRISCREKVEGRSFAEQSKR